MTAYVATPIPQPELSTCRAWDVAGGAEPYIVRCGMNDEWTCSCPHFRFRIGARGRTVCKHVATVLREQMRAATKRWHAGEPGHA